jgi:hypothetical protein
MLGLPLKTTFFFGFLVLLIIVFSFGELKIRVPVSLINFPYNWVEIMGWKFSDELEVLLP